MNVAAYERDAVTCSDGETCEGGTWARAPCVAGTRETAAPCEGTGALCSVESGHACSWFAVGLPGAAAAAADQAEVPASSAGRGRPGLGVDSGGRETSRGPASSAGPGLPRAPGADWSDPGTSRGSVGSSLASSAARGLRALRVDLDDPETSRGCSESAPASRAAREASHAGQAPSQVPWASGRGPSRAFLLPLAF